MKSKPAEHVVSATVRVTAPSHRVWQALTDPGALVRWYAPGCRWEIPDPREGALVRFYNSETDIQTATIERCDPPTELALRWTPDWNQPAISLLNAYTVREEGSSTLITLSQSGYGSVPESQRSSWIEADEGAFPAIASTLAAYPE